MKKKNNKKTRRRHQTKKKRTKKITHCHVSQCGFEKKHVNVRVRVDFEKKKKTRKNKQTLYVVFRFLGEKGPDGGAI